MSRRIFARVRKHVPGKMNKLEARYADMLENKRQAGIILEYKFESVKLRLADKTWYTPDFMVIGSDGTVELHEVKGFWEDDARVKIKVAAETFPFLFRAYTVKKGEWQVETFKE